MSLYITPLSKSFGEQFLDEIVYWISENLEPEDVFDNNELEAWAEDNGWAKEE